MAGQFRVRLKRKVERGATKLPKNVQKALGLLIDDLVASGPIQRSWSNFSALEKEDAYHCHLTRRYVACWTHKNGSIEIEVYYAGSRENAPY